MYSRSQFCKRTGLSRKALRIYEEKELLSPLIASNQRAFFSDSDVCRAILINKLRGAGVGINQIENLLASSSENLADVGALIRREVLNRIEVSNAALRQLDDYIKDAVSQPERVRFGGFWAYGSKIHLKKSNVTDYVRSFARDVRPLRKKSRIIAFYSNETKSSVDLACYVEDQGSSGFRALNLNRYFISEETRCAVQTKGVVGDYDCFEKDYDILSEFQETCSNLKLQERSSIEIYHDYPIDSNRSVFEAQILV